MNNLKIRIKTYGCRMNVCDSEIIASILAKGGYDNVDEYNGSAADVLILNCCSVREDGHEVALSQVENALQDNQDIKLILCGCYSTLLSNSLFKEIPGISAIVRPRSYNELPDTICRIIHGEKHFVVDNEISNDLYESVDPCILTNLSNRAVVVAKGCNQNCAYCIEPYTRGQERYISPDTILRNVDKMLLRKCDTEITLVGHLIDHYHYGDVSFPKLLVLTAKKCEGVGVPLKYISSHPATYSDNILDTVLAHDNILKIVHLPVQSGSDSILQRMHRGYTVSEFKNKIKHIRDRCPEMKIVTDIMVGFCGESNQDFEDSVKLIEDICPSDINIYKFSMRRHTFAFNHYLDDVTETVKQHRYNIMKQLKNSLV